MVCQNFDRGNLANITIDPLVIPFSKQMKIPVALGQICSKANVTENLEIIGNLVRQASQKNCKMIFFPECSDFIEGEFTKNITPELQKLTKENNIWMSIGIHTLTFHNTKFRNRQLILNNHGEEIDHYDKIHLFELLKESDKFEAGNLLKVVDTPLGYMGLGICYDLRFPKFAWKLKELGANVLTFPSAFTMRTGVHFESLLVARAIETQCYVIGAAQFGKHGEKRESFGNSLIVDPWGTILARGTEAPELITADIDMPLLEDIRANMPVLEHQRQDIY